MFYEGTEKRLEITVKQTNLLSFPENFWKDMIAQAGAFIISKIENNNTTAYLLSESSLFVWKNRVLLITCGNTHLIKAAQFFQKKIVKEQIQSLLFQRHQAFQPELQKSSFEQDSTLLHSHLQGKTQHWQGKYNGDLFFFGKLTKDPLNNKQILMLHGLSGDFSTKLHTGKQSAKLIETKVSLATFFPQLLIDHYAFTPKGYSLNAISKENYLTIHITPEKLSTYLSLESSFSKLTLQPFLEHLINLFNPQQNQLMAFAKSDVGRLEVTVEQLQV